MHPLLRHHSNFQHRVNSFHGENLSSQITNHLCCCQGGFSLKGSFLVKRQVEDEVSCPDLKRSEEVSRAPDLHSSKFSVVLPFSLGMSVETLTREEPSAGSVCAAIPGFRLNWQRPIVSQRWLARDRYNNLSREGSICSHLANWFHSDLEARPFTRIDDPWKTN